MAERTPDRPALRRLNAQIVGNVGLYYVAYQLSLRGWNVMPTARNARGIDIVAYSAKGDNYIGVQVKALSDRSPVPLGGGVDALMGQWWVILINVCDKPVAYVMRPEEVSASAHRGEKDGRVSFWLQPPKYALPHYLEAWDRIGRGDSPSDKIALEAT